MRTGWLFACLGLASCAGLLGIKSSDRERSFEHRAHLVRGVSCTSCHLGMGQAGDTGPLHLPSKTRCLECHTAAHDPGDCASCHGRSSARQGAELAKRHLVFDHRSHIARQDGQCVRCHTEAGSKDAPSLRPAMAVCLSCHAHKDQWKTRECDACHVDLPAELAKPSSHVVHEGDFLREHGVRAASSRDLCATCHAEPFCAACHGTTAPTLPHRLDFGKTTSPSLHRAGFRLRHADEARANPGLCTTCHSDERTCSDCHAARRVGAAPGIRTPHPPGWVRARGGEHGRAARMEPGSCAACHGGAGEALCVGCHKVGGPGGNPHGPGFGSALDKGRDQPCRQCHAP
ncbi:MAG: hypothetical protein IPG50_21095 [Myxococcales bacterium]|nr:hypothetical protein [Myxococcales bacterium]